MGIIFITIKDNDLIDNWVKKLINYEIKLEK